MIDIKDLTFAFKGQPPLFTNLNLQVARGDAWTIIGPSGCGKSTLLYLLAGLKKPDRGCIKISGERVERPRPQTGLVLQDHGLLPWATVRENVLLGLKIRGFYGPDGRHAPIEVDTDTARTARQASDWMERLGIAFLKDKYPSQLSRGQRQRTAIARTLVLAPDLLLMDEPFSALDVPIRIDLQHVMLKFHLESNLTSIVVTHNIEEAVFLGRKILVFSGIGDDRISIVENELPECGKERDLPAFRAQCNKLQRLLGRSYEKNA